VKMPESNLKKYILWWKDGITTGELSEQLKEWDKQLVELLPIAVKILYPKERDC